MNRNRPILITRSAGRDPLIEKWAHDSGVPLLERAFIQTVSLPGVEIPTTTWIFFSSPSGAKLYFENYPLRAQKIAALSNGTAKAVLKAGYKLDFVGRPEQEPAETGARFFAGLGANEAVFFPLSNLSKKSIVAQNRGHKLIEKTTYETRPAPFKLEIMPRLILFTSPSNVDGFLMSNEILPDTVLCAIGRTTENHLKNLGFMNVYVARSTHEQDLLELIREHVQV